MTDNTQPEAREFTMSQYASKDDMIGAMRKRIAELESELKAVGAGGVSGPLMGIAAPPTAQAEGWRPIETAPKYTEHGVRQHLMLGYAPDEIHEDGFVSQGYWMEAEEDAPDNMGHDGGWVDVHFDFFRCGRSFGAEAYRSAGTQPTHWKPLPPPPTSAEGVEHG